MPDIMDLLTSGLQPDQSQAPAPQAPTPTPGPSVDYLNQLMGQQGQQQPPQANPLQALQQNVNNPLFTQDPATAYHRFINQIYYGNQDGSEPTRKQKILRPIEDFLESVIGYQRPELRMLPAAQQAYQEQTGRLAQQTGIEHWLGTIFEQNRRNDIGQQNANTQAYRAQLTGEENQARDHARDLRNTIEKSYREAQEQHLSAEDTRLKVQNDYQQFQMKYPHDALQYAQVLNKASKAGDTSAMDDLNTILPIMLGLGVARNPAASVGTTRDSSSYAQGGVIHNDSTTQKQFLLNRLFGTPNAPTNNGSQFLPNLLRGITGGAPQGAQQANPVAPNQATPAPSPQTPQAPAPQTPVAASQQPVQSSPQTPLGGNDYNKYNDPFEPNPPANLKIPAPIQVERNKAMGEITQQITKLRPFEQQASLLVSRLAQDIAANGKNSKFMGLINGSDLFQTLRGTVGTVTPEEALTGNNFLDLLYNKLGANVRGRFTVPEIAGHSRAVGGQLQQPMNALLKVASLKLQAEAAQMYWERALRGDGSAKTLSNDMPALAQIMDKELTRLAGAMQDPKQKALIASGGPIVGNMEQLYNDYKQFGGHSRYEVEQQALKNRAALAGRQ